NPSVEGHLGAHEQAAPPTSSPRTLAAGGSWSWQNPLPNGNSLFAVSCPATTTCIAAGSNGQILATADSGSTWAQQTSGISTAINGLSCGGAAFCIAAGDFGALLKTSNGGATWTGQTGNSGNFFAGVSCPTTSTCFAV